jgi:hypothetical protein
VQISSRGFFFFSTMLPSFAKSFSAWVARPEERRAWSPQNFAPHYSILIYLHTQANHQSQASSLRMTHLE